MPMYPLQVSEQIVDPFLTCFSIKGCKSTASVLPITFAQTLSFLQSIPELGSGMSGMLDLDGRKENLLTDDGSEFEKDFRDAAEQLGLARYHSRLRISQDNYCDE